MTELSRIFGTTRLPAWARPEALAVDIKLASAHLTALQEARLVQSRRDGKRMLYRLSGQDVAQLGVTLRQVAEEHLVELRLAVQQMMPGAANFERRQVFVQRAKLPKDKTVLVSWNTSSFAPPGGHGAAHGRLRERAPVV